MNWGTAEKGDKFSYINASVALYFATYFNLKHLDQEETFEHNEFKN
jgi:hypothetical protein